MVVSVTVTSAAPLSDQQKTTLLSGLNKKFGEVNLTEKLDEKIIGGIKVTVGSKQYDASVATKLEQLKHSIT